MTTKEQENVNAQWHLKPSQLRRKGAAVYKTDCFEKKKKFTWKSHWYVFSRYIYVFAVSCVKVEMGWNQIDRSDVWEKTGIFFLKRKNGLAVVCDASAHVVLFPPTHRKRLKVHTMSTHRYDILKPCSLTNTCGSWPCLERLRSLHRIHAYIVLSYYYPSSASLNLTECANNIHNIRILLGDFFFKPIISMT